MKRIIIDNSYVFYFKFFKTNAINYNLIFMQSKLVSIVFHDKISFTFVLGMSYRLLTNNKKKNKETEKKIIKFLFFSFCIMNIMTAI